MMSHALSQRHGSSLNHHEACQQQRFVSRRPVLGRPTRSLQAQSCHLQAAVHPVCRSAPRRTRLQCRAAKSPAAQPAVEEQQPVNEPSAFEQYPLKVEWNRLPRSRLQATVEVPQPLVARIWHEVLKELRTNYKNIPGYRPQDQVPEHLIVNEHGGMDKFKFTMIEAILESTVGEAMKEYAEQMIQDSDRFDDPVQSLFETLEKNKPFTYRVSADLYPQLQWKRPYQDIQLQVEAVEHEDPQKAVEEQIEVMRREKAKTTIVQGRGLQEGDLVVVAFEAQNPQTNEPMPNTKHERMQIDTNIPGQIPLPGLVEQMLGMTVKEKRDFVLPVPPAWVEIAQGAPEARVLVELVELFTYIDVPEVTDEWVSENVEGQGSVANFRNNLLQAVQAEAQVNTDQKVRMEIMRELSNMVDVEIPEFLILQVAENEFQAKLFEVGQKLGMEQMKQLSTEEVYNNYVESRRDELELIQRAVMAADDIFEQEKLEVKEADMVNEVNAALAESRESGAKLDMEQLKEQAFQVLKAHEVHAWILQNTRVNIVNSQGKPYTQYSAASAAGST
ncbi:hypothetical protein WJX73_008579 [Symbiochloris irregularis]|uniref:Trigger factor C-terminal domain-containing protein n=1 Tax=Symbiochloris irregularis TaxID=706552 RepID=A0AAW1NRK3_9CHLO